MKLSFKLTHALLVLSLTFLPMFCMTSSDVDMVPQQSQLMQSAHAMIDEFKTNGQNPLRSLVVREQHLHSLLYDLITSLPREFIELIVAYDDPKGLRGECVHKGNDAHADAILDLAELPGGCVAASSISFNYGGSTDVWGVDNYSKPKVGYNPHTFLARIASNLLAQKTDSAIYLWNCQSQESQNALFGDIWSIVQLNDQLVATGLSNGEIQVWDFTDDCFIPTRPIRKINPQKVDEFTVNCVRTLEKLPNDLLAACSVYGTMGFWNWKTGEQYGKTIDAHKGYNRIIGLLLLSNQVLASNSWNEIKLWDWRKGECLKTISLDKKEEALFTSKMVVLPDSGLLAVGMSDGTVRLFNPITGACTMKFRAGNFDIIALLVLTQKRSDDATFVTGSQKNGEIKWWR